MKLDEAGYKLIMQFEGLVLNPYLDSIGVPTIGYGSTYYENGNKVKMTDPPITKERAFQLFKHEADKFAVKVDALVKPELKQNQFNAVVSLAYNIGLGNFGKSTLLKKVNATPNDATISTEFARWNKAGGKVIAGLTNRRKLESKTYFS